MSDYDLATLKIEVNTTDLKTATAQLTAFADASKKASATQIASQKEEDVYSRAGIKTLAERREKTTALSAAMKQLQTDHAAGIIVGLEYSRMHDDITKAQNLAIHGNSRHRGAIRQTAAAMASLTFEMTGAIYGLVALTAALAAPAMPGIGLMKTVEDTKLGMASILISMGRINGIAPTLPEALAISSGMMDKLVADSMRFGMSIEALANTLRATLAPGLAAGMSLDEIQKVATVGTIAVKTIGLDARQTVQEVRDLVAGGIQAASSTLATSLGIKDADIKRWREAGTLYDELMNKMSGFQIASAENANTLSGSWSILQTKIALLMSSDNGFNALKSTVKGISDYIGKFNEQTNKMEFNPDLVKSVKAYWDILVSVGDVLGGIGKTIVTLSPVISFVATALSTVAKYMLEIAAIAATWGMLVIFRNIATAVMAYEATIASLAIAYKTLTTATFVQVAATNLWGASITRLAITMAAFAASNPMLVIATVIVGAVYAIKTSFDNATASTKEFEKTIKGLALEELYSKKHKLEVEMEAENNSWMRNGTSISHYRQQLSLLNREIDRTEGKKSAGEVKSVPKETDTWSKLYENQVQKKADAIKKLDEQYLIETKRFSDSQEHMITLAKQYNEKRAVIDEQFNKEKKSKISEAQKWIDKLTEMSALNDAAAAKQDTLTNAEKAYIEVINELTSGKLKATDAERTLIIEKAASAVVSKNEADATAELNKQLEYGIKYRNKYWNEIQTETEKLAEKATEMEFENSLIGQTKEKIDELTKAREYNNIALADQALAAMVAGNGTEAEIAAYAKLVEQLYRVKAAKEGKTAADAIVESTKAATAEAEKQWKMIDGFAHTAFNNILDKGKNVFKELGNAIKKYLLDMLYKMTLQKWLINIGVLGGTTAAGSAMAMGGQAAAGGGGIDSWLNIGSTLNSAYGAFTTGLSQSVAQVGATMWNAGAETIGNAIMGNIAPITMALSYVGAGLAGISIGTMIAGDKKVGGISGSQMSTAGAGIGLLISGGNPLGALVGGAIGGIVNAAFGMGARQSGTTTLAGQFGAEGFAGQYQTPWTQEGGWFRSDRSGTDVQGLGAEQQAALTAVVAGTKSVFDQLILSSGDALVAIDGWSFAIDRQVSTQEQQNQLIIDMADSMGNYMIPSLVEFQKEGESLADTAVRMKDTFILTDAILGMVGGTFGSVGLASMEMRSNIVDLMGGLQSANSLMQGYYNAFYTDAERVANGWTQMNNAMTALGVETLPNTNAAFRALVEAQDLSTESGQQTFATLMGLASSFNDLTFAAAALDEAAKAIADNLAEWQNKYAVLIGRTTERAIQWQTDLASTTDVATQSVINLYYAQLDLNDANDAAIALANQGTELSLRVMELEGAASSALAIRRMIELDALDASLRPIQERIWALEDEATATITANEAAEANAALVIEAENAIYEARRKNLDEAKAHVDAVFNALKLAVDTQRQALTSAYDIAVRGAKTQIDSITKSVGNLRSISELLKSSIEALLPMSRAQAQAFIRASISAGGVGDSAKLKQSLEAISKPSEGLFGNFIDYQRDFIRTANDISALSNLTDVSLTAEERLLSIAEDQLKIVKDDYQVQMSILDGVILSAQGQIDAINGTTVAVMSIATAMSGLASAIAAQGVAQTAVSAIPTPSTSFTPISTPATITLDEAYQSILGRAPAVGGRTFWTAAFGDTLDQTELAQFLQGAQPELAAISSGTQNEWLRSMGVPGYATGTNYVPYDMLAQIHEGEAIVPKQYNPAANGFMQSKAANDDTANEIKNLRAELQAIGLALAKNTGEAAKILRKFDGNGLPAERVVAA